MPSRAPETCEVAIVGGGPSGLGAAIELARAGVSDVHVLEREATAGGIPRHCGHPPFGMREFARWLTGPQYAGRLVARAVALGVNIHTDTTVVALSPGGLMKLSTPDGERELTARRVLLGTGVRETPRSARLVSGGRPRGVTTTGALQSMVYLARARPFMRPVIVGTELVSFSALLTCRHAGISPVAMIESAARPTAWRAATALPAVLGVAVHLGTDVQRILGTERVDGVQLAGDAGDVLACDGVVFSGRFVPESSLLRDSHIAVDPFSGGPVVDQFGRCSDDSYLAAGNLLRPVETAGWCWNEGRQVARWIHAALRGELPTPRDAIAVVPYHPAIKYVVPQRWFEGGAAQGGDGARLQLRVNHAVKGMLSFRSGERVLFERRLSALPERRILVDLPREALTRADDAIRVEFTES